MCASVGLKNYGEHYENMTKGILGSPITLAGINLSIFLSFVLYHSFIIKIIGVDITKNGWTQQVGLKGENLKVWTPSGMSKVSILISKADAN